MSNLLQMRKAATGYLLRSVLSPDRVSVAKNGLTASRCFSTATSVQFNDNEEEPPSEFQGSSTPSIWEYAPEWCQEYEQHSHKYDLIQFLEKHCADHCTWQNSQKKVCPGSWADGFQKRRKRFVWPPR
ncbi:hypothetical protein GUITHDRAFT_152441 [Guillardia theta CCMP2712]|uniref:Uncharacterized protein n=2 Tax=Guillardia theta TaxID=55529 RepID=L1JCM6_GUITC|nr:hypothetical protein GUITHDRAFT_152441 [Guillardia theta CCMP2712]EKX46266.1 hypothetical protein GUITHDRAFT_152441 [Guillardia theta CCMP2712]|mmetsp:Transcript_33435/g.105345  ORF Transcript_33435/g.105345 Transcript_33435/m.105345 type:complete len:128 (+) Transcript_33435:429-812(+)|eukprot:XP_005833246.1 hypothetical protein GUITHDRAFT_152441 [Guillardia theta CCMP2712]